MKSIFIGIACLLLFTQNKAQNHLTDSLLKVFENQTGAAKAVTALNISKSYWVYRGTGSRAVFDQARNWGRKAYDLADKSNADSIRGETAYQLGLIDFYSYQYGGSFDLAVYRFLSALPDLKKYNSQLTLGYCYSFLGNSYHLIGKLPESLPYLDSAVTLLKSLGDTDFATFSLATLGHCYFDLGDYKNAYAIGNEAIKLSQHTKDTFPRIYSLLHLENLYLAAGLPEMALQYFHRILGLGPYEKKIEPNTYKTGMERWAFSIAADAYFRMGMMDSTLWVAKKIDYDTTDFYSMDFYGKLYSAQKNYGAALSCFLRAYQQAISLGHVIRIAQNAIELAANYKELNQLEEAEKYAMIGFQKSSGIHALLEMSRSAGLLSDIYATKTDFKRALNYELMNRSLNDSVASDQFKRRLFLVQVQDELDKQKQAALLLSQENKIRDQQLKQSATVRNFLIAGILVLLLLAAIIIRSNRQRRLSNLLLKEEKEKVEQTLHDLKAAQTQLVQREKMASLGELTAGVAHEIQNPLNFVNNFSDLNRELLSELQQDMTSGKYESVNELTEDIIKNEGKINEHGKRAESIVKGMLMHSRGGVGQKEKVNLNALADEYLRLAYHGFRSKAKDQLAAESLLNAKLITDFDQDLPEMVVVPQDIGRVLLNIYNNAFYALAEKAKNAPADFHPTIEVKTKKVNDAVQVSVRDNGDGIPEAIRHKIFQPFFTTKPTGRGTGLGLSLSYDIISKGHNGKLEVTGHEGEGAEFIFTLPI